MNEDLFKAILAMDSYNRGYGQGINSLSDIEGVGIGEAEVYKSNSTTEAQGIGFYAISYKFPDDSVVVSYRGTDDLPTNPASPFDWSTPDTKNGWFIGAGQTASGNSQAEMAIKFYKTVANTVEPNPQDNAYLEADITLTGHSMGGGFAGYVGALYQQNAVMN